MSKICPVCSATYPDASVFCQTDGSTLHAVGLTEDLVGSVVADRYLVTDLLGEGGMGRVYLARHVRLPQQAAIKVLRPELVRDPAAVARFNREASNASRIDDEHVARVYDFGETSEGMVYLAMEYVPGRTLRHVLGEAGPLAPERAAGIVRQIADALDAAHRLGIVHRDLKPDNVLVADGFDGEDRIKVVDFGIAKALGANEGTKGLTQTGFIVGTPDFMSPEQLVGGSLDARSDVYALALVAFQCLTGSLPFDSTTPERAMTARLVEQPHRLFETMPAVPWPAEVQAVFDAGLAREAKDRPESAGAFARALSESIADWRTARGATPRLSVAVPAPGAATVPARAAGAAPSAAPATAPASVTPAPASGASGSWLAPAIAISAGALVVAALVVGGVMLARNRGAGARTGAVVADSTPVVATNPPAATPESSVAPPPAAGAAADTSAGTSPAVVAPTAASPAKLSPSERHAPKAESREPRAENSAIAARRTLDSITTALDPVTANDATARSAIAALGALMPRLATSVDSVWASVRLAEANLLLGRAPQACEALGVARSLARSAAQREAVRKYDTQLQCGG